MSDKKKQQDKAARVITRSLADVLLGQSTYRDECDRLRRLGVETGPELEDRLAALKASLEQLESDPAALDSELETLSPELFAGLVDALAHRRDAATLARLRDRRPGREEQKALGAALHRLETQGVVIPRPAPAPAARPAGEPPEIYLSALDPEGGAMLTVFWPGVLEESCLVIRLSESEGFAGVSAPKLTPRAFRRDMKLDEDRPGQAMFPIEVPHVLFLLEEAFNRARNQHRIIPFDVTRLVHRLEDYSQARAQQSLPTGAAEMKPTAGSIDTIAPLMPVPAIQGWVIDPRLLEPALRKIMDVMASQLVVSEAMRQERFEAVLREAAAEYFTPERRAKAARRLEEIALWLDRTKLPPLAELAYGSAIAMRDASMPASDIPIAVGIFHFNVARFLREVFPPDRFPREEESGEQAAGEAAPPAEDKPLIVLP